MPLRRCVSCRESLRKEELVRFTRDAEGEWRPDPTGRSGGRGAWICRKETCRNARALGRFFRGQAARIAQELETLESGAPTPAGTVNDGGIDV